MEQMPIKSNHVSRCFQSVRNYNILKILSKTNQINKQNFIQGSTNGAKKLCDSMIEERKRLDLGKCRGCTKLGYAFRFLNTPSLMCGTIIVRLNAVIS